MVLSRGVEFLSRFQHVRRWLFCTENGIFLHVATHTTCNVFVPFCFVGLRLLHFLLSKLFSADVHAATFRPHFSLFSADSHFGCSMFLFLRDRLRVTSEMKKLASGRKMIEIWGRVLVIWECPEFSITGPREKWKILSRFYHVSITKLKTWITILVRSEYGDYFAPHRYGCPSNNMKSPKQEVTDAFGEFHTDIIDNHSRENDVDALLFSFPLPIFGRAPVAGLCVPVCSHQPLLLLALFLVGLPLLVRWYGANKIVIIMMSWQDKIQYDKIR
jgi:hypothetical protein